MSVNLMVAMGNIVRDPELRYTPKGTAVIEGSVALNRVWNTEDGEKKEEVTFLSFAGFGRMAETISQYFQKGSLIHLTGYLKQENWEDKTTGEKKSKLKLIVSSFSFCGSSTKRDAQSEDAPPRQRPSRAPSRAPSRSAAPANEPDESPIDDDDVPF